jgi:hypothetical protein
MVDRAYTLDEIDQLRDAARVHYGLGSNFDAPELEARLRTLMVAGIEPSTIQASNSRRRHRQILLDTSRTRALTEDERRVLKTLQEKANG